jgi:hypothetical protein
MDAVSSKPKRSMRVATMFTGIAVCTVGMAYGGAAQAATVEHTPNGIGFSNKPASRQSGNIEETVACGSNTWLHVVSENNQQSFCFGFRGTSVPENEVGMYAQCGGNNYGWLSWYPDHKTPFYRGTTYRVLKWAHLDKVHISGWGGTEKCSAWN